MSTSWEILDTGAPGLSFLESFTPAYNRCVRGGLAGEASELAFQEDVARRYYTPAGVDFRLLRAEAERLESGRLALLDTVDRLGAHHTDLANVWQGTTSDAALRRQRDLINGAGTVAEAINRMTTGLTTAMSRLEQACHAKAAAVNALHAAGVAGLTADEVDLLARVATGRPSEDELHQAATCCGIAVQPELLAGLPDSYKSALRADITTWLTNGFVPAFQTYRDAFDRACAESDTECASAWGTFDAVCAAVATADPTAATSAPDASDSQSDQPAAPEPAATVPWMGLPMGCPDGDREHEHKTRLPPSDDVFEDAEDIEGIEGIEGIEDVVDPNVAGLDEDSPAPEEPAPDRDDLALLEQLDSLPERAGEEIDAGEEPFELRLEELG